MRKFIVLGFGFFLLVGMICVVTGTLLPVLLEKYDRTYSAGGMALFAQMAGFLAGVITAPAMLRWVGRKRLLSFCLLGLSLIYAALFFLPPWHVYVVLGIFVGFCGGLLEPSVSSYVISHVRERTAIVMSRLEVAFGIGSLGFPVLCSVLIHYDLWEFAFLFVVLFALSLFYFWYQYPLSEETESQETENTGKSGRIVGRSGVLFFFFIAFFLIYVGVEQSFSNYIPSILVERLHIGESSAALGVTFFWSAMVVGRLVAGHVSETVGYVRFLLGSCILSFVTFSGILLIDQVILTYVLISLLGLWMSGIFAVALILANRSLQGNTETMTSFMITSASVGGALVTYIAGIGLDHVSVRMTLIGYVVLLGVLTTIIYGIKFWMSENRKPIRKGLKEKVERMT